jgi:hypothetical protein
MSQLPDDQPIVDAMSQEYLENPVAPPGDELATAAEIADIIGAAA